MIASWKWQGSRRRREQDTAHRRLRLRFGGEPPRRYGAAEWCDLFLVAAQQAGVGQWLPNDPGRVMKPA